MDRPGPTKEPVNTTDRATADPSPSVWAFGYGKHGQLGKLTNQETLPTHIKSLEGRMVTQVACGGAFCSALTVYGHVYTWGDVRGSVPAPEAFLRGKHIVKIACTAFETFALAKDGKVWSWGEVTPKPGEQDPNKKTILSTPCVLKGEIHNVKIIDFACGALHALFLSDTGKVFSLGQNSFGQLGQLHTSTKGESRHPTLIELMSEHVVTHVSCGGNHSLVLTDKGDLYSWGSNRHHQLGLEDKKQDIIQIPYKLTWTIPNIKQLSSGDYHNLILTKSGELFSFGQADKGQLGIGPEKATQWKPQKIETSRPVVKVSSGGGLRCSHSLALLDDGTLVSWGSGDNGQLGHGNTEACLKPSPIAFFANHKVVDFACGWLHVLTGEVPQNLNQDVLLERYTFNETGLGLFGNGDNFQWKQRFGKTYAREVTKSPIELKQLVGSGGIPQQGFLQKAWGMFKIKKDIRGLMLGLDASGRTTVLYKMKLGEIVTTIPTIGFNVEDVEIYGINFTLWDVGGPDKIRPLWRHYYQNTELVIYFVDSNDRDRIDETALELQKVLREDELRDTVLLVLANKQDLPNAMSVEEVTDRLGLHQLRSRVWNVFGTCGPTGAGLYEAFAWAAQALKNM